MGVSTSAEVRLASHGSSAPPGPAGREVFEVLARAHANMLATYLGSLVRSPDLADDLFQETLLVAWRKLDTYDGGRPFGPWLRGIAGKLVLRERERVGTSQFLNCEPRVLDALETRFAGREQEGEENESLLARLRECLTHLPERLRAVVHLVYAEGLVLRDAAKALETKEEAAKKRLQRARTQLADCLRGGTAR